MKKELKDKYAGLFDELTESEQIKTEAVLNFNLGGEWETNLKQIDFTEDTQTVDNEILTIPRKLEI